MSYLVSVELTFWPPFPIVFLGKKLMCAGHTEGMGSYTSLPWGQGVDRSYGILHGAFVYSPLFCYSLSNLWLGTHGYLFYSLDFNLILLYFIVQIVPALSIETFFSEPLCPFAVPNSLLCVCTHTRTTSFCSGTKIALDFFFSLTQP